MPLQNRVTPFGDITAASWRGLVIGNRGVLHDDRQRIVRSTQVTRWIACRLAFRGWHRQVMQPRRWTELFFLDEAVAFSAGHRPCGECRNADYKKFRRLWDATFGGPAGADAMDTVLHAERLEGRSKRTYRTSLDALPDGTYVVVDGEAWLVWGSELLKWSAEGYHERHARRGLVEVDVITPRSIVNIFEAGYRPLIYPASFAPEVSVRDDEQFSG